MPICKVLPFTRHWDNTSLKDHPLTQHLSDLATCNVYYILTINSRARYLAHSSFRYNSFCSSDPLCHKVHQVGPIPPTSEDDCIGASNKRSAKIGTLLLYSHGKSVYDSINLRFRLCTKQLTYHYHHPTRPCCNHNSHVV